MISHDYTGSAVSRDLLHGLIPLQASDRCLCEGTARPALTALPCVSLTSQSRSVHFILCESPIVHPNPAHLHIPPYPPSALATSPTNKNDKNKQSFKKKSSCGRRSVTVCYIVYTLSSKQLCLQIFVAMSHWCQLSCLWPEAPSPSLSLPILHHTLVHRSDALQHATTRVPLVTSAGLSATSF